MIKISKEQRQLIGKILKFLGSVVTLAFTTFFVQACAASF